MSRRFNDSKLPLLFTVFLAIASWAFIIGSVIVVRWLFA